MKPAGSGMYRLGEGLVLVVAKQSATSRRVAPLVADLARRAASAAVDAQGDPALPLGEEVIPDAIGGAIPAPAGAGAGR